MTNRKYFSLLIALPLSVSVGVLAQQNPPSNKRKGTETSKSTPRKYRLTPQPQKHEQVENGKFVSDIGDLYAPEFYPNGRQGLSNAYIPGIIGFDLFNDISPIFSLHNDSQPMTIAEFQSQGANKNITYGSMPDRYYGSSLSRPVRTGETVDIGLSIDNYKVASGPFNTSLVYWSKSKKRQLSPSPPEVTCSMVWAC